MRRRAGVPRGLAALLLVAVAVLPAAALDWGGIAPGETTMDAVRARHGEPTRASTQKLDQYDAAQWVYEAAQAPVGMERMIVDFGLLAPQGYRPQVVRSVLLHPKPGTFNRPLVLQGWGMPTAIGAQSGAPAFMYEEGLFVSFDGEGWGVSSMLFTPKQTMPAAEPEPAR